ncbi:MAG: hypothetical protein R3D80_20855 [Paracoccaceae bacterium]
MGHLADLLDATRLSPPPTGKMAFLRHFRFDRVDSGKVVETATSVQLPHLMMQAGLFPSAADRRPSGPARADDPGGLLFGPSPPTKARRALRSSAR